MKKVNIAMLALLLVLQVLFSPLTVFAEGDPLSSLPAAGESAGNETVEEVQEDTETSGDVSTEPTDETNTDEGTDAGSEEGTDEGTDAGTEEGTDEGTDAGSEEGADEGTDAGTEEGADEETDAGSEEDAGGEVDEATEEGTEEDLLASLMALPANMQADVKMNFTGLRLYDPNGHLIVEADDLFSYTGPNPKKGDNVFLSYVFEVEPSQDYGIGSSFEFPMPANMIEEYFDGSFDQARSLEETGDWLAYHSTYDSDAKTVTVTLDSELEEGSVGTIQFTFNSRFGNFADENELEQDLIIPIEGGASTTLPFKFDPLGSGNLLTKSAGAINRAEDGTVSIPWTIWANTAGQKLENASLDDLPDSKHELTGNITVEQYKVGLNGFNPSTPGAPVDTRSETEFPIQLADGYYAYKITYDTVVTASPTTSSENYTNTATLTGDDIPGNTTAGASQSVSYGPSLAKSQIGDKYKSKWSIKYNWLGQKIDADDAKLTDTISKPGATGKHIIDYTSLKVYRVTLSADGQSAESLTELGEGAEYSFNGSKADDRFTLDFSGDANSDGDVAAAYLIEYETVLEDEFVTNANSGTVTNTVTRADNDEAKSATVTLSPNIFNKSRGTIDYVNKTITWTLTINAEKDLKNFTISDSFTTENKAGDSLQHTLTTWDGTDLYRVTGANELSYSITDQDGNAPTAGNAGFEIAFTDDIPQGTTVRIQYKTKFDVKTNGGVANAYINTAHASWDGAASIDNEANNRRAHYTPDPSSPTFNNGYKRVSVDNSVQEFSWRIAVNINKQNLNNATVTDTLGAGHYIAVPDGETLQEQVTITRLNLASSEDGQKTASQLSSSKWSIDPTLTDGKVTGFVITFAGLTASENNEAYLIEYKTKDADDIYGQSTGDASRYTNTAILDTPDSGSYRYDATATITNRANELITKSASILPAQDIINWTVIVNASNSQLGEIVLTDKPSANQLLLLDTFKKQEIKLNAGGTSVNVGGITEINASEISVQGDGSFSINLGDLSGKGYIITYSTYFLGDGNEGEDVSNEASIGYAAAEGSGTSDKGKDLKPFKYDFSDTSASGAKGTLQVNKFKVNPLTGETDVLAGVKFELWNKANTIKLYEGITNVDGIVAFEQVRYGKYILKEETPTGYITASDIEITMSAALDMVVGGSPYVVNNIEDVDLSGACPAFTLTVKNMDGQLEANKVITLLDGNGTVVYTGTTNALGQLTDINRPGTTGTFVQAGVYTVKDADDVVLGTVIVNFNNGDCQGEVQPIPACPTFTIVVHNEDNDVRPDVTVILKNSAGDIITTATTDENGKFTVPVTTPAGIYKLYEDRQYLGEVVISYQNGNCEAELNVARVCETFILTVYDADGRANANASVTIVDKDDPSNTVTPMTPTDSEGKVAIANLSPRTYLVNVNGTQVGEFAVGTDCEATVQPPIACPTFVVTLLDEDGLVTAGTEVTLTNTVTNAAFTRTVNGSGEVSFLSSLGDVPPGEYEVAISSGSDAGKVLGTFTVTYTGNCEAEVVKPRACTVFEITVIAPNGTTPKANTRVIVKDSADAEVFNGMTSAEGKIMLPANQAVGTYTVHEVLPDQSLEQLGSVNVSYKDDCQAVVMKNACPTYTLTVNNSDATPFAAGVNIDIKNQAGDVVATGVTDAAGQIVFSDKAKLQQDETYTAYVSQSGVELGDFTVSYIDESCGATLQTPANACPLVTITVHDEDGNPRPDVRVTLKDLSNTTIASETTNADGKFVVPTTTPAGTYKLYEDKQLVGEVVISYQNGNCEAVLNPQDIARVCETFALTVHDQNGNTRSAAAVTIVSKATNTVVATMTTDSDGIVLLSNLAPGAYEVYEASTKLGEFIVGTDCEATVQPPIACPTFVVTLFDEDGLVTAGTEVTLTNTVTNAAFTRTVNGSGEVSFLSSLGDVPPGEYEVAISSGSDAGKVLGTFTVTYTGNCEAEVVKPRACTVFEITVIAPNGTTPKANTRVIVKDSADAEVFNGMTSAEGKIMLPANQAVGTYTVHEVLPDQSLEQLGSVNVSYKDDCQAVVMKNACPTYTLTVNNSDATPFAAGVNIDIKNQAGDVVATGVTDAAGQIVFSDKAKLQQDETYTAYVSQSGVELGDFTVSYIDESCGATLQTPANACPLVTITVHDEDGNPRPDVRVTLKDLSNTTIASETTNADGKFVVPATTPAGTYKLYEDKQFVGEVVISYQNGNCEAVLNPQDIARVCETFALTVHDQNGNTRSAAAVTIVSKATNTVVATMTTDSDGIVLLSNLAPGAYEVYEASTKLGEFIVGTDCEATVQPPIACPNFVVTLFDEDGLVTAGTEVTLMNTVTNAAFTRTVNGSGEVSFLSSLGDVPPGEYEVAISSGSDAGKVLGTFTVTYTGNCEAEVVKPRACTVFEITVIAPNGTTPKANTRVIVKDSADAEVFNGMTSAEGKIMLPANQAPGQVIVYEANDDGTAGEELGRVNVTYRQDCQGIVMKNACPTFTLVVVDNDLSAVGAGVKVTIVNKAGEIVEAGVTNTDGKIVFNDKAKLQHGVTYTVLNESGIELGNITVNYINETCEAAVQVPVNACPVFTLIVQNMYGQTREGVSFEIRNTEGAVIATGTTDENGEAVIPYTVEPGVYYVYEGTSYVGTINVGEQCSALVKPYVPQGPVPTPDVSPEPAPEPTPETDPEPTPEGDTEPTVETDPESTPDADHSESTPDTDQSPTPEGTPEPTTPEQNADVSPVQTQKPKPDSITAGKEETASNHSAAPAGKGVGGAKNELPKTGDSISLMIWLFIGSALLLIAILLRGKRRMHSE